MPYRIDKINQLIRELISRLIQKEISFKPEVFVTIFKVDTAKDLSHTKIFLSVFPIKERNYVMKTLEKETFRLQKEMNRKLHLKIFPKLRFVLDNTQEKASEIEEIIDKIKKEKK
jgi:ribosome-binding factor A